MNLISTILNKHKNKIFYFSIGTLSLYLLNNYIYNKITEYNSKAKLDSLLKENIEKRFKQNQVDASLTTLSLVEMLKNQVVVLVGLEDLTERLRICEKSEKESLWNKIQEKSFVRLLVSVVGFNYLYFIVKIQMNLIGRFAYVDSVEKVVSKDATKQQKSLSIENERMYLAISWYFTFIGLQDLVRRAEETVQNYFRDHVIGLTATKSSEEVNEIIEALFMDLVSKLSSFADLAVPRQDELSKVITLSMTNSSDKSVQVPLLNVPEQVGSLVTETRTISESDETIKVLKQCIIQTKDKVKLSLTSIKNSKAFASYFPVLNKVATVDVLNSSATNEYLLELSNLPSVEALSAVIYSQ